jgi:hypothetical protein
MMMTRRLMMVACVLAMSSGLGCATSTGDEVNTSGRPVLNMEWKA